uniref:Uncharacterized protein n=1 Tax=Picea sitchensis TaxID=3332 RepID=A9NPF2_PICSI|nr:unknown [Picea sitchensis]
MCEAEENQGAGAGDKAKCHRVLRARRAATYGSIGMSGRAMGKRLCEAEENQGAGAGDKASTAAKYGIISIFAGLVGRRMCEAERLWEVMLKLWNAKCLFSAGHCMSLEMLWNAKCQGVRTLYVTGDAGCL